MSAAGTSDEANLPGPLGVTINDKEDYVEVICVIQGVKKPFLGYFCKNTVVNEDIFKERSLRLLVEIEKNNNKKDKYLYVVKQLPEAILPEQCSYKLDRNKVIMYLYKAVSASWQNSLDLHGLDISNE